MSDIKIVFAVYGALAKDNAQAADVSSALRASIQNNGTSVTINKASMGGDPCPGETKHFGAQITRNGGTYFYACQEGQTIDFEQGGMPGA